MDKELRVLIERVINMDLESSTIAECVDKIMPEFKQLIESEGNKARIDENNRWVTQLVTSSHPALNEKFGKIIAGGLIAMCYERLKELEEVNQ